MADEELRKADAEEGGGQLGYEELAMNVVPASATEEPSEVGRRAGGLGLLAGLVVAAAVIIVVGTRLVSNAPPGQEAEQRLRARLQSSSAWRLGTVMEARYLAGDRLRLDFSPRLGTTKDEERELIRQAAKEVMGILMQERPDRDLYLDGYQGERQIVRAELRHKSSLVSRQGKQVPDLVVRVEGDPEEGLGQAYGRSGRPIAPR